MTANQLRAARIRCLCENFDVLPRRGSGCIDLSRARQYLCNNFRDLWAGSYDATRKAIQRLGVTADTTRVELEAMLLSAEGVAEVDGGAPDAQCSHVYVYEHRILGVLYVGQATRTSRHLEHKRPQGGHSAIWFISQYDAPGMMTVRLIPVDRRSLDSAEQYYIGELRPRLNCRLNASDRAPLSHEEMAAVVERGLESQHNDWCI